MSQNPYPTLVINSSDRVAFRNIDTDGDSFKEHDTWHLSNPVSGVQTINTWEIYYNIWLTLIKTPEGHYQILRTHNRKDWTLIHDHSLQIYNLFWVDSGHMVFSAEDGWYRTTDSGETWTKFGDTGTYGLTSINVASNFLSLDETPYDGPHAKVATFVTIGSYRYLIAYAEDHKIYFMRYPSGSWSIFLDTNDIWTGKWYPAMASSSVGTLVGIGNQLWRLSYDADTIFYPELMHEVQYTIKNIAVSSNSKWPQFLITIETPDGFDNLLSWSYDVGDSLQPDMNRVGPFTAVQSVYPNGESHINTMFVAMGTRKIGGLQSYKIITSAKQD